MLAQLTVVSAQDDLKAFLEDWDTQREQLFQSLVQLAELGGCFFCATDNPQTGQCRAFASKFFLANFDEKWIRSTKDSRVFEVPVGTNVDDEVSLVQHLLGPMLPRACEPPSGPALQGADFHGPYGQWVPHAQGGYVNKFPPVVLDTKKTIKRASMFSAQLPYPEQVTLNQGNCDAAAAESTSLDACTSLDARVQSTTPQPTTPQPDSGCEWTTSELQSLHLETADSQSDRDGGLDLTFVEGQVENLALDAPQTTPTTLTVEYNDADRTLFLTVLRDLIMDIKTQQSKRGGKARGNGAPVGSFQFTSHKWNNFAMTKHWDKIPGQVLLPANAIQEYKNLWRGYLLQEKGLSRNGAQYTVLEDLAREVCEDRG